jgi:hypothetical protein
MYPMDKQEDTTIGFALLAPIAQPEVIGKILVHVGLWPLNYSDLREAISMEKRYFTSDLSSRS